jgi:uncharacterized membrane protein YedE/YeeE
MSKLLTALVSGIIFAIGLGIAGMTLPQRVISFLDVFGSWNPALGFVMIGAIAVHSIAYLIARKKSSPALDSCFHVPDKNAIDFKLLFGSALFGVGWGLGGFCPGPAITSLASGFSTVLTFVAAMITGMLFFKLLKIVDLIK